jgi:Uma2 family endonuclease
MASVSYIGEQRVVLDNISWSTYLAILNDVENRRGRIAYDRGVLEIMSPSKRHENTKNLIGRMVEIFTDVLEIEVDSVCSTTFRREDLQRGFEADESYYIQHAAAVAGKDEIDLTIDPPPDLVIEVEISRSSLDKFQLYRALGIPEVWRYDGDTLRMYELGGDEYEEIGQSQVLPRFPINKARGLIGQRTARGETPMMREFRQWVQQNVAQ